MTNHFKLLDVIALLKNLPGKKLKQGQVGTIVEIFNNHHYEVEFCNNSGETITLVSIHEKDLLLLHYELEAV